MNSLKQFNWWRIAAYALLATSAWGLGAALFLSTQYMQWVLATMLAYGIVRLEWVIDNLKSAATTYTTECNPYD